VTPNALEAQLLVAQGAHAPQGVAVSLAEMERIGRRLLELLDCAHVALTLGGQGVLLLHRDALPMHLPAHAVAHPNDVGAGDSFAAALALALTAGATVEEAARIGIDAAGLAVTKRWTAVASRQELLQRVSLREHAEHATGAPDERGAASEGELGRRRALAHLKRRLQAERLAGRRVVFTNGVFDLLTAGHVEFLRQAKALGQVLVVGVNTDRGAAALKGERPINAERDRLALVAALDPVDHALLFDEAMPAALIRALRPDVHAKGGDYADEALPEDEAVREVGGRVVILPLAGASSERRMIERIVALAANGTSGSNGTAPHVGATQAGGQL
jgi:D-beta-D-heptose 7-phosphate kinase/D-beta-D-heptose 1-phosphate adenosyltransferase